MRQSANKQQFQPHV